MDTGPEVVTQSSGSEGSRHEIDWDSFASGYDVLASINPSYHENIALLRRALPALGLAGDSVVCDLGAGTGNFICAVANDLPNARFVHLDGDASMNEIATEKYASRGIDATVHCCRAQDASYPAESFDLIICVNALYAMSPQEDVLRKVKRWLKPNGVFFVIDYGRQVKLLDWGWYLARTCLRRYGLMQTLRLLRSTREGIKQNRRGSMGQAEGVYWLHSTEHFGQVLTESGFLVEQLAPCYRGYCDMAICRPRR